METVKLHCKRAMQLLEAEYGNQLEYSGIAKKIYEILGKMLLDQNALDKAVDVDWGGLIRAFADDTMDYTSQIVFELEAIRKAV